MCIGGVAVWCPAGSFKPSALRKRAKAAGAADEAIEEAGDADDAKSAMVALILAQPGR